MAQFPREQGTLFFPNTDLSRYLNMCLVVGTEMWHTIFPRVTDRLYHQERLW